MITYVRCGCTGAYVYEAHSRNCSFNNCHTVASGKRSDGSDGYCDFKKSRGYIFFHSRYRNLDFM